MDSAKHFRTLSRCAALAVAGATVFSLFARHAWLAELASHFRVQYLMALIALSAVFLATRQKLLAVAALAFAIPNAWYVVPYIIPLTIPASVAAPSGQDISVTSLNLFYRNRSFSVVRDYLEQSNSDVLVLLELTPEWMTQLREVTAKYPFWMSVNRRSPWGLGVFSKYPIHDTRYTDLGVSGSVNVVVKLELPGGAVQLVAVHLASPTAPGRVAERNRQLARLAELLGQEPAQGMPRLLVGDLNLSPFSPYFRDLLARTGMQDARRSQGLLGTWPTWMPPLQIAIDHCIADPALGVTSVERGPRVGSDHYPLEISFRTAG